MLKRSIKVRVNFDDDQVEEANAARMDAYNVFKRGVMEFDDYNYAAYNPHVLLEDPKITEAEENAT